MLCCSRCSLKYTVVSNSKANHVNTDPELPAVLVKISAISDLFSPICPQVISREIIPALTPTQVLWHNINTLTFLPTVAYLPIGLEVPPLALKWNQDFLLLGSLIMKQRNLTATTLSAAEIGQAVLSGDPRCVGEILTEPVKSSTVDNCNTVGLISACSAVFSKEVKYAESAVDWYRSGDRNDLVEAGSSSLCHPQLSGANTAITDHHSPLTACQGVDIFQEMEDDFATDERNTEEARTRDFYDRLNCLRVMNPGPNPVCGSVNIGSSMVSGVSKVPLLFDIPKIVTGAIETDINIFPRLNNAFLKAPYASDCIVNTNSLHGHGYVGDRNVRTVSAAVIDISDDEELEVSTLQRSIVSVPDINTFKIVTCTSAKSKCGCSPCMPHLSANGKHAYNAADDGDEFISSRAPENWLDNNRKRTLKRSKPNFSPTSKIKSEISNASSPAMDPRDKIGNINRTMENSSASSAVTTSVILNTHIGATLTTSGTPLMSASSPSTKMSSVKKILLRDDSYSGPLMGGMPNNCFCSSGMQSVSCHHISTLSNLSQMSEDAPQNISDEKKQQKKEINEIQTTIDTTLIMNQSN